MPDPAARPLARTLTGQPVSALGVTLTPEARLSGWEWGAPGGEGQGIFVRLVPTAVRVTAADGAESTVVLTNTTAQAVRGMLVGAAAIAAVASLVMVLARLWGRR
jgi:hypothetical protein